jgi:hypothetical protein
MHGAVLPLPQYAFMAWYSLKKSTGTTLSLPLPLPLPYFLSVLYCKLLELGENFDEVFSGFQPCQVSV